MADWAVPRIWVAGERVSASKMNEISNALTVLYPYTAGGDIAYASDADTLAALAKPSGLALLQSTSAGVPSWVVGGSAGQVVRRNIAGTGFELSAANPHCIVSRSADFSYTSGVITWNTDVLDTGGWHSTSTNTSRITVPETGIYIPGAVLSYYEGSGGAAGPRIISLLKNGVDLMGFRYTGYTDGVPRSLLIPHMPISLAANDYLEVGANLSTTRTVLAAESRFWVMRIG